MTTVYRPSSSSTGDVAITGDISASGTIKTVGITSAANATAITIDSSENVGFSTATPKSKVEIHDSGSGDKTILRLRSTPGLGDTQYIGFDGSENSTRARIGSELVSGGNGELVFETLQGASLTEVIRCDKLGVVTIAKDTLRVATQKTPATAAATGTKGDIVHDTNFIYVCTATDTWKRVAIATW